uniref:Uncharacterized protein n=1 Tax=Tanacetum cinerariifolium TaxID=118510 RepID=A0A699K7R2_TANCI|nr:hypothetical protein [Tanacetum cinerariifolium]
MEKSKRANESSHLNDKEKLHAPLPIVCGFFVADSGIQPQRWCSGQTRSVETQGESSSMNFRRKSGFTKYGSSSQTDVGDKKCWLRRFSS